MSTHQIPRSPITGLCPCCATRLAQTIEAVFGGNWQGVNTMGKLAKIRADLHRLQNTCTQVHG